MISRRGWLRLAVLSLGMVILTADLSVVEAQGNDRIRLFAFMSAGMTKAKAKYEQIKNNTRRKFSFELEKGTPGQTLTVRVGGNQIGSATVDGFGRAKFELDTKMGHNVPTLTAGTPVAVYANGVLLMSGTLR